MNKKEQKNILLEKRLEQLGHIQERNAGSAAVGRAKFLSEAARLRYGKQKTVKNVTRRAWQFALASLLVILVIFGGGLGVANAASDSLPGDFLYPAKLFKEDVQLAFTSDPQGKITLLMEYSYMRVNEMVGLTERDLAIPAGTIERMENHVQQAMILAAGLDDAAMQAALNQIRARLQEQVSLMGQVTAEGDGLMYRARQQLEVRIQYVDESKEDPQLFRQQMRVGQEDVTLPTDPAATSTVDDPGKGPGAPGGSDGGPGPQQTPVSTPGSGNGPGPSGP